MQGKLGEILLSLSYQPAVGRLNIIVMKCKDLKAKDITGASGNKHFRSYSNRGLVPETYYKLIKASVVKNVAKMLGRSELINVSVVRNVAIMLGRSDS